MDAFACGCGVVCFLGMLFLMSNHFGWGGRVFCFLLAFVGAWMAPPTEDHSSFLLGYFLILIVLFVIVCIGMALVGACWIREKLRFAKALREGMPLRPLDDTPKIWRGPRH